MARLGGRKAFIRYRPRKSKALMKALEDKNVRRLLIKNMMKATRLNGHAAEAVMRRKIQGGLSPRNAALTQMIKGDDKPMVDSSQLFGSITSKPVTVRKVFVGVLRNADAFNIAVVTHEGMAVKVTEKMRSMFFNLWLASGARSTQSGGTSASPQPLTGRAAELFSRSKGSWWPLKASTTAIIIPRRRWVNEAFRDPDMRALAKKNWMAAYKFTFQQIAAAAKAG